jgi:hypothetical protein
MSEVAAFLWMAVGFALVAIVMLGLGGRPLPREISTFGRSSPAERNYDRRSAILTQTGFVSLGCAALACGFAGFLVWG